LQQTQKGKNTERKWARELHHNAIKMNIFDYGLVVKRSGQPSLYVAMNKNRRREMGNLTENKVLKKSLII
jgi:hypothetical protein